MSISLGFFTCNLINREKALDILGLCDGRHSINSLPKEQFGWKKFQITFNKTAKNEQALYVVKESNQKQHNFIININEKTEGTKIFQGSYPAFSNCSSSK